MKAKVGAGKRGLTLRISPDLHWRLERLAARTKRSKSFLANKAIGAYVARELAIVEGITRGLENMRAGRRLKRHRYTTRRNNPG